MSQRLTCRWRHVWPGPGCNWNSSHVIHLYIQSTFFVHYCDSHYIMQLPVCPQSCAVASSCRRRSSNPSGNKQVRFPFPVDIWDVGIEGEVLTLSDDVCRFLLTGLSQKDVCSLWLQRIRQQTSVQSNLCFIMSSSTNSTLFLIISFFCIISYRSFTFVWL